MQVNINEIFPTRREAEDFIRVMLENYHPAGYGTRLKLIEPEKEGVPYRVVGSRQSSCD